MEWNRDWNIESISKHSYSFTVLWVYSTMKKETRSRDNGFYWYQSKVDTILTSSIKMSHENNYIRIREVGVRTVWFARTLLPNGLTTTGLTPFFELLIWCSLMFKKIKVWSFEVEENRLKQMSFLNRNFGFILYSLCKRTLSTLSVTFPSFQGPLTII